VRPRRPERPIAALSGGNQQKVVLARWFEMDFRLLVLEEPTAGIDVGARADIYALLRQAALAGKAVLIASSDFSEIEQLCHRVVVFNRGRVSGELQGPAISLAALTRHASAQLARQELVVA
ncbi:MAG: sugar ABC transporter ATP-binding protein, partial [Parvibaculaceae bacterium]